MTRTQSDLFISLLAMLIGVGIIVTLPFEVPDAGFGSLLDMTSAAFFPFLAAILIAICGAALGLTVLLKRKTPDAGSDDKIEPTGIRPFLMISAFVAYIPLINLLGMMTASALMIAVLPAVYGYAKARWIVPVAFTVPAGVYVLFEQVLKVLFPHGAVF